MLLGLDPHEDTPVEILHVVLLGFVKYFWRDLITNQIKADQKPLLIQRLNSYDVSGLGISKIGGETLVNYSGSLTGRDFRVISQVAPFVIHDLVPTDVFNAWVSLSKLVPLIYQPTIDDIDQFTVSQFSYNTFGVELITQAIRSHLNKKSAVSCLLPLNGPLDGSTNLNSILFFTSRTIFDALAQLFSLQLKPSNLSMR